MVGVGGNGLILASMNLRSKPLSVLRLWGFDWDSRMQHLYDLFAASLTGFPPRETLDFSVKSLNQCGKSQGHEIHSNGYSVWLASSM